MKKLYGLFLVVMLCAGMSAWGNDKTSANATPAQASQNLLANPGFESGTTSWYGDRCSISATTKTKYSGYKALYVSSRQGYLAGPAQYITALIKNGSSYNVEAWAKNYSGSAYVRVAIVVKVGTQTLYFRTPTFVVGSSGWKKISGKVQPLWTGTLTSASFRIETSSGTGSFYADDMLLTENQDYANKYPFPYEQPGLLGIKPSATIDTKTDILSYYETWKSQHVGTQIVYLGPNMVTVSYVKGDLTGDKELSTAWGPLYKGITASEHTGYGMLISVIMGDKTTFFQLSNLYDIFRSCNSANLMSWAVPILISTGKIVTSSSTCSRRRCATDGDLDIALAFLMAYNQWGENWYLNKAKAMIKDLNNNLVYCNHPKMYWLKVADGITDAQNDDGTPKDKLALVTRSSDFLISHCRIFYKIGPQDGSPNDATQLNYAANDMMTILDTFRTDWSPVGLVSDFLDINPGCYMQKTYPPPDPEHQERKLHFAQASNKDAYMNDMEEDSPGGYGFNACRVPMRLALAYRFGESSIKDYLSATGTPRGMVDWLWKDVAKVATNSQWYNEIKSGFKIGNGLATGSEVRNAFIAPFVAGCVIDSKYQSELDAGWNYIKTQKLEYFDDTLTLLCMLIASGYWWMPQ